MSAVRHSSSDIKLEDAVTEEQFDRIFNVNVKGLFFCYKYAGLQMVAQGRGGRMIGAASVVGKKGEMAQYNTGQFIIR